MEEPCQLRQAMKSGWKDLGQLRKNFLSLSSPALGRQLDALPWLMGVLPSGCMAPAVGESGCLPVFEGFSSPALKRKSS